MPAYSHIHTLMGLTMPGCILIYSHICTIPCLYLFKPEDLSQAAERLYIYEAGFWIQTAGQLWLTVHSAAKNAAGVAISVMILPVRACTTLRAPNRE